MPQPKFSILIVDDHVILREGMISLLRSVPEFEIVGEAGSVSEAVHKASLLKPDMILMDFSLPDGTGLDATRRILANLPDTKIVFLTVHDSDEELFAAIRYGAKGYLLKNIPVHQMIKALKGMVYGQAPISREMTTRLIEEFAKSSSQTSSALMPVDLLSSRELQIAQAVAEGATNQEIGQRFFISANTVKNHIHNILKKLKLKNRHELARYIHHIDESAPGKL
ncbi:MAG TPA: response regulator transcription factor [Anaerolineales bacterium]|nr:response regulator transcription factor [Anaerolineales bacterium]